jgi:aminodeoxychorismate lyase
MIAFVNGQFVAEQDAVVSVHDRGFLYGDGLFETIRVARARLFRLDAHLARLEQGALALGLRLPFPRAELAAHADALVQRNEAAEAVLRLTVSRGCGPRGYSPRGADRPTLVMTLHPAPALDPARVHHWQLVTATDRVPAGERLASYKTANKLVNILARREAEEQGADEALLLNTRDEVTEAASANVFWLQAGRIFTPSLTAGVLPGITRSVVQEICAGRGMPVQESPAPRALLLAAEAVFVTQSVLGVIAVRSLDGHPLPCPPLVAELHRAFCDLLRAE